LDQGHNRFLGETASPSKNSIREINYSQEYLIGFYQELQFEVNAEKVWNKVKKSIY